MNGIFNEEALRSLKHMEALKKELLDWKEAKWRQNSKVIWLAQGDENTLFFHNYAKKRKNIWSIKNEIGEQVQSFNHMAKVASNHYNQLFKEPPRENIVEIVEMAAFLPDFVNQKQNLVLMKVSMVELEGVIESF
jgi:hypothetical protein